MDYLMFYTELRYMKETVQAIPFHAGEKFYGHRNLEIHYKDFIFIETSQTTKGKQCTNFTLNEMV
ncbi:hypothetical protein OIU84_028850 [Salix udensis]|uniref:Uncharacterized protein n=1 Tax=Salix udensis TaxID=889485 RepID=A0AAD6P9Y9_9ROSI|nr:hypothetical protein OIU84_028850 [Salix udensis]